jgi:hypothetical protein
MPIYQRKTKGITKEDKEVEIVLEVEMEITINLKADLNLEIMIEMIETSIKNKPHKQNQLLTKTKNKQNKANKSNKIKGNILIW